MIYRISVYVDVSHDVLPFAFKDVIYAVTEDYEVIAAEAEVAEAPSDNINKPIPKEEDKKE